MKIGVIHGRFQVLHKGHMEYLLAGKSKCDFLYIGITNPDPKLTLLSDKDQNRSSPDSNPLTYYERFQMIKTSLLEAGISWQEFDIVPFPISFPEMIKYYIPVDSLFFISIYDDWGWHKYNKLNTLGFEIEVLWVRELSEKITSGSEVRDLIRNDKPWEHLVPASVERFLKDNNLISKIKNTIKC